MEGPLRIRSGSDFMDMTWLEILGDAENYAKECSGKSRKDYTSRADFAKAVANTGWGLSLRNETQNLPELDLITLKAANGTDYSGGELINEAATLEQKYSIKKDDIIAVNIYVPLDLTWNHRETGERGSKYVSSLLQHLGKSLI